MIQADNGKQLIAEVIVQSQIPYFLTKQCINGQMFNKRYSILNLTPLEGGYIYIPAQRSSCEGSKGVVSKRPGFTVLSGST